MKNLGNGRWQCPACKGIFRPGDPSMPGGKRLSCCLSCAKVRNDQQRFLPAVVNFLPPLNRERLNAQAAARRKLEELADQRSVEF